MTIYIVRNERNEEVSAYTDVDRANLIAEELQSATFQSYRVEELACESESAEQSV